MRRGVIGGFFGGATVMYLADPDRGKRRRAATPDHIVAPGWAVSDPHAVCVRSVGNDRIVLEGPVLRHEDNNLLRRVKAVANIREVTNRRKTRSHGVSITRDQLHAVSADQEQEAW